MVNWMAMLPTRAEQLRARKGTAAPKQKQFIEKIMEERWELFISFFEGEPKTVNELMEKTGWSRSGVGKRLQKGPFKLTGTHRILNKECDQKINGGRPYKVELWEVDL